MPRRATPKAATPRPAALEVPRDRDHATLEIDGRTVTLTNLRKPFWPEPLKVGVRKPDWRSSCLSDNDAYGR